MDKEIKRNGYIYSKDTADGFKRMQRLGIPRPLFRLEDKLSKTLRTVYKNIIRKMLLQFKQLTPRAMTTDGNEKDNLQDLLDFFDQMAKEEAAADEAQKQVEQRMQIANSASQLQSEWDQTHQSDNLENMIQNAIKPILEENQADYLKKLEADSSKGFQAIVNSFSLDKQKLFESNMENLRKFYLDNSLERIKGEEDWLKQMFLLKLNDYVIGEDDTLDVKQITDYLSQEAHNSARFFARDQMARFNKAVTLSTYSTAGVTKVKWCTCHDARVRKTHKDLDGQIFDINNLPPEINDYNCRCGLIPVEYAN